MGRNRSISRIGSLIRQATADVPGIAKASDTTTSSVVASVRTFSNNAKRTEASNITNTVRQALFRSSHGFGTLFGESGDMWDRHVGGLWGMSAMIWISRCIKWMIHSNILYFVPFKRVLRECW